MTEAVRAQLDWPQLDGHPSRVEVELNDVRGRRLMTDLDLTAEPGTPCTNGNPWCTYQEPHDHGSLACDPSCPCRTEGPTT